MGKFVLISNVFTATLLILFLTIGFFSVYQISIVQSVIYKAPQVCCCDRDGNGDYTICSIESRGLCVGSYDQYGNPTSKVFPEEKCNQTNTPSTTTSTESNS